MHALIVARPHMVFGDTSLMEIIIQHKRANLMIEYSLNYMIFGERKRETETDCLEVDTITIEGHCNLTYAIL